MEVTSQGLDRHRVAGVKFEVVAFTNLTQDHLDWHGDMETYFASKAQLFTADYAPLAVINTDDVWGSRLASQTPLEVLRVGGDGDVGAENVRLGRGGSEFTLCFPTGRVDVKFSLVGPFNVENALMAAGIAHALGFGMEAVKAGLESVASVPGRLETVDANTGFAVIVDYAHTPDAVSGVLRAARELTDAKLICVVGCGGDRDRTKRPLMGEAATALADFTVITSDNPRSEDPDAILDEVEPGAVQGGGKYERITDRRAAIRRAFEVADDGDVIVIAGKGHETGQEINGVVHPFDDRVVAAEIAGEL